MVLPPFEVEVELPVLPPLEVLVEPLVLVVEVMITPLRTAAAAAEETAEETAAETAAAGTAADHGHAAAARAGEGRELGKRLRKRDRDHCHLRGAIAVALILDHAADALHLLGLLQHDALGALGVLHRRLGVNSQESSRQPTGVRRHAPAPPQSNAPLRSCGETDFARAILTDTGLFLLRYGSAGLEDPAPVASLITQKTGLILREQSR